MPRPYQTDHPRHGAGRATIRNLAQVTALVGDNGYRPAVMNAWREFFPSVDDQPALHLLNLGVLGRDTRVQLNVVGVLT